VSTSGTPYIDHSSLVAFAGSRVNVPKAEVDAHRAQVRRLRDHLQRVIDEHEHHRLIKTLHSGSVAKGTALKSVSDMDLVAYLDASQVPTGSKPKLIAELAAILRTAYGGTKAAEDFQEQDHSVKIKFHGSGLDVDVVPVLYAGLPDDRGDLILKSGERVETSVPLHLEFIRRRKTLHGKDYPQLIRFLKFWAREQKRIRGDTFRCKSFLLELIVAHLADTIPLGDYINGLESVFAWIVRTGLATRVSFDDYYGVGDMPSSSKDAILVYDPVNPSNNICKTYTTMDRDILVEAAADALDAVTAARYGTTRTYSIDCWQRVFGPTFRGDQ
jgi:tRNA nucleotidyltransferase (CCA-adding enzyme)